MPLFTREACACQEDSSASCVLAGICYNPLFLRVYVYVTGGGGSVQEGASDAAVGRAVSLVEIRLDVQMNELTPPRLC